MKFTKRKFFVIASAFCIGVLLSAILSWKTVALIAAALAFAACFLKIDE